MLRLFLSTCIFLALSTSPLHAQTVKELLNEAVQDYQFQDFDEAEKKFRSVVDQAPGNLTAHYYLGVILLQKKKPEEAIQFLEHAAKSPARPDGIDKVLGQAYVAADKPEKALPLYKGLMEKEPNNDAYAYEYANTLKATGNTKSAIGIYEQLIAKGGSYADASRYQLGQIYTDMGAYGSAVSLFEDVDSNSPYRKVADSYIKALERTTRPLSFYLSSKYYYDTNPKSASTITGSAGQGGGSQATTLIGLISTRQWEITPELRTKASYMFYGKYHVQGFAQSSDFAGHFLNPQISYHPNKDLEYLLKIDLQKFYYNHQFLSDNIGATFTATHNLTSQFSWNLHAAYLQKRHTESYASSGTTTSLAYLDANTSSFGGGATYTVKDWGGSLSVDYTFNNEKTVETNNPNTTLANKARDGRAREHAVRVDANIPFTGILDRFSLASSYSYSKKNYLNVQTPDPLNLGLGLYSDVQGQKINSTLQTYDIKLNATIWKPWGLKASAGYEYTRGKSATTSLTYASRKYYGTLSASY